MLQPVVYKLYDFKVLKLGQNLHANMEDFRRAGHIYPYPGLRTEFGNTYNLCWTWISSILLQICLHRWLTWQK